MQMRSSGSRGDGIQERQEIEGDANASAGISRWPLSCRRSTGPSQSTPTSAAFEEFESNGDMRQLTCILFAVGSGTDWTS